VERLEEVFERMGKPARGKPCEAIQGIIEDGKEIMESFGDSAALDAGLLAGAQAVEHCEISRYRTLKTWADEHTLKIHHNDRFLAHNPCIVARRQQRHVTRSAIELGAVVHFYPENSGNMELEVWRLATFCLGNRLH
jgi:hypothetical protein